MSLDDEINRLVDGMKPKGQRITYAQGVVDHVDAGAGTDGNDVIYVTVWGGTIPIPYHAGLSVTDGDVVSVHIVDHSPLILGKLAGFVDLS